MLWLVDPVPLSLELSKSREHHTPKLYLHMMAMQADVEAVSAVWKSGSFFIESRVTILQYGSYFPQLWSDELQFYLCHIF